MNTLTAFLDASHLYGSSDAEARELREGTGGLLKVILRAITAAAAETTIITITATTTTAGTAAMRTKTAKPAHCLETNIFQPK